MGVGGGGAADGELESVMEVCFCYSARICVITGRIVDVCTLFSPQLFCGVCQIWEYCREDLYKC